MAKRKVYRLWIAIEQHDPNTDQYRDLTAEECGGDAFMLGPTIPTKWQAIELAREIEQDNKGIVLTAARRQKRKKK